MRIWYLIKTRKGHTRKDRERMAAEVEGETGVLY